MSNENVNEVNSTDEISTLEQAIGAIDAVPEIQKHCIDASFVSNRSGKTNNLLKPHDGVTDGALITKVGIEYRLKTPTPVTTVNVKVGSANAKLRVEVKDIEGKIVKSKLIPSDSDPNELIAKLWAVASAVRVCSDSSIRFDKFSVTEIRIGFLSPDDISDAFNIVREYDQIRTGIISLAEQEHKQIETRKSELVKEKTSIDKHKESVEIELKHQAEKSEKILKENEQQIQALHSEREKSTIDVQSLQGQIITLQASKKSEEESLQSVEKKNHDLQVEIETAKELISQKREEKEKLEANLQVLRHDVQEWMSKKHLFTADLEGLLKENNFQSKIFLMLSMVPLFLAGYVTWRLYEGTILMLQTILTTTPPESIWAYLATRFPYATVAGITIYVTMRYGFLPLIGKVFDLYELRSRLQEKCFLVKKLTESAARLANLSDKEAAQLLVERQMEYIEQTFASRLVVNPAVAVMKELDERKNLGKPV